MNVGDCSQEGTSTSTCLEMGRNFFERLVICQGFPLETGKRRSSTIGNLFKFEVYLFIPAKRILCEAAAALALQPRRQ